MHVALLSAYYPPHIGGVEAVVAALTTRLSRAHQVTVITAASGDVPGVTHEDGVCVHRLPVLNVTEPWGVPYPVVIGPGVSKALAAIRTADVCHAHGALYATSILGAHSGVPMVLTEHVGLVPYANPVISKAQDSGWKLVGDRVVRRSRAITTVSGRVEAWLSDRFPDRRVSLIPNGVDLQRFRPSTSVERAAIRDSFGLPLHDVLVLFAGRDTPKKNLHIALAIPRDGFTLVVCGASRNLAGDSLLDLGALPSERMADLMRCVDVVVMPSQGEGFPIVAQEAMASGVPLVLLWDQGYEALVERSVVAACNSEQEVASAVLALVTNSHQRAAAAHAALEWSRSRWSWEATTTAYEELYRTVSEPIGSATGEK